MKNLAAKIYEIDEFPQIGGWYAIEVWENGKLIQSFIKSSKKLADEEFSKAGYVRLTSEERPTQVRTQSQ